MAKLSKPRAGSLQFWPRKRAEHFLPSVNWKPVKGEGILGFIAYKVGMATALVKDTTDKSMTANKRIYIPVTILETPNMKIFSVRFYNHGQVIKEVVVSTDSLLKKVVRIPKTAGKLEIPPVYDDIRILVYSLAHQTTVKKTPDLAELAIGGGNKLDLVKSLIGKEITVKNVLKFSLLDVRGLTKGKGLEGAVPRFGITLKSHKSEKGVRRPGSLAPWHPARVTFRTPQAGQLGMFTRVHYNLRIINLNTITEKNINPGTGFKNYGRVQTSYVIVKGSVQGPPKRQILITPALRPTKEQVKKKYEFMELIL
nr:50S ribosomal protein L3P [uncultured archaeon]